MRCHRRGVAPSSHRATMQAMGHRIHQMRFVGTKVLISIAIILIVVVFNKRCRNHIFTTMSIGSASDWQLLGEGNANAVFSYHGDDPTLVCDA